MYCHYNVIKYNVIIYKTYMSDNFHKKQFYFIFIFDEVVKFKKKQKIKQ
jgi:hypothetical protein